MSVPLSPLSERALLINIQAALALEARAEILDLLCNLAEAYITRGWTQEGADLLCFLAQQPDADVDTAERTTEALAELATWVCPRVLLDAEDFAELATLDDIIEYVFADMPEN